MLVLYGTYALGKQRTTSAGALLFVTVLLLAGIEALDQLSFHVSSELGACRQIAEFLESFLPVSFLFLTLTYGRSEEFHALRNMRTGLASAAILFPAVLLLFAANDISYPSSFQANRIVYLGNVAYWYYIGMMLTFIISLVNVETTFTATQGKERQRIKFEAIGLLGVLSVLVFYYSQGLLYKTINMNLLPVRSAVLLLSVMLMAYSKIFRGSHVRVIVSRHIFYRSITLIVVGFYLVSIGLVGEVMRYFGINYGQDLTIFIGFAAGMFMLAVFFSQRLRRRTKVYISKHFFAHKHDYREEWLIFTKRLARCSSRQEVQDAILTMFQYTFGLNGASLYLLANEDRYVRMSAHGMPEEPIDLQLSAEMKAYFLKRERVLRVFDEQYSPSKAEEDFLIRARAFLVVPLIRNERVDGLVVLGNQIVSEELIFEDYDLMKILARQASQALANFRLLEELADAREVAAVGRISSFVVHDLKNMASSLSLMVDNAKDHMDNPDFKRDLMGSMRNTLTKMQNLTQRLKSIPERHAMAPKPTNLHDLTGSIVKEFQNMRPDARIRHTGAAAISAVDEDEMKKVIFNLVQNALDASTKEGAITVETGTEKGNVFISVSDSGCGMTREFIDHGLFRPFTTTKKHGLGIGLFQSRQIVEAHHGKIEVASSHGEGSTFIVRLPELLEKPA